MAFELFTQTSQFVRQPVDDVLVGATTANTLELLLDLLQLPVHALDHVF